ncbi:MAG: phosphoribosyltransferase [Chitinophagaceae bacterium]|nr:phosphoribosyltransferase [Chitinophagaceae bacterium]
MKEKRILLLDKQRIAFKLRRMAFEIWERNCDEKEIVVIGINGSGKVVADNLVEILHEISPLKIRTITLTINKKSPLDFAYEGTENLTGKTVVLVDDVANSGKTLMYSLNCLLAYNLKKVMVAVLVDRNHKSFPIAADIVGHTVATTIQDHIDVETSGKKVKAVYLE